MLPIMVLVVFVKHRVKRLLVIRISQLNLHCQYMLFHAVTKQFSLVRGTYKKWYEYKKGLG